MANEKQIRDVMTRNPACVSAKDSIRDVARIMAREDTGVVPVVDGRKVIGMITDRDIVVRLVAEGKDPSSAKANEAMTRDVRSVKEDNTVSDALQLMSNARIRRIPVVDTNNEIVGIVSMKDIATGSKDTNDVGKTVEKISEGPANN